MFGYCLEPIKANKIILYGTQDSQHPIKKAATKNRQLMTGLSPLVSAVHANCLRTVNFLFVEIIHLSLQNQKRPVYQRLPSFVNNSRLMYPLGTYFLVQVLQACQI